MYSKRSKFDLTLLCIFFILWLILALCSWKNNSILLTFQSIVVFSVFITIAVNLILVKLRYRLKFGRWLQFFYHCLIANVLVMFYIFTFSESPVRDSIMIGVAIVSVELFQCVYEE